MEFPGTKVTKQEDADPPTLEKLKADVALLQETLLRTDKFFRLKKLWVVEIYGFPAKGKKGGVMTLIHKNCIYKTDEGEQDENGRRLTIKLQHAKLQGGKDTLITNIYAPNSPSMAYYVDLTTWFAQSNYSHHVVAGDFNTVMHVCM